MSLELHAVALFIRRADTEDLLDRVTVYRDAMEPAAVDLMENELWRRGLTPEQVATHAASRAATTVRRADGSAVRCVYCDRPAVSRRWGWHRLWGRIPIAYVPLPRCEVHAG
jgi:hypothetical protein